MVIRDARHAAHNFRSVYSLTARRRNGEGYQSSRDVGTSQGERDYWGRGPWAGDDGGRRKDVRRGDWIEHCRLSRTRTNELLEIHPSHPVGTRISQQQRVFRQF
jgi:hypothetical protein